MKSKVFYIYFSFFCAFSVFLSAQEITILQQTPTSITLEYKPEISKLEINKNVFDFNFKDAELISFENSIYKTPFISFDFVVKSKTGNSISVVSANYETIDGKVVKYNHISPNSSINTKNSTNLADGTFNEFNLLKLAEVKIFKRALVQRINVFPIQFDAINKKIKLYRRIIFRLNISNSNKTEKFTILNSLLKNYVVNFEQAKNWGLAQDKKFNKITNSVLSTGTWYRFEVTKEGIYKIDKNDLSKYEINLSTVDPKTIKIYAYSGKRLPENPNSVKQNELSEVPVKFVYENNQFSYLLFYARGVDFWYYDSAKLKIVRNKNFFSEKNYYWITSGGKKAKEMSEIQSLNNPSAVKQDFTKAFLFEEKELINIIKSGKIYLGDSFTLNNSQRTYTNTLNDLIPDSTVNYKISFANIGKNRKLLQIYESGKLIYGDRIRGGSYYVEGKISLINLSLKQNYPDNRSVLKFLFDASSATGYLDYFEISYYRELKAVENRAILFSEKTGPVEYTVKNFTGDIASIQVFDVTNFDKVKEVTNTNINGSQVSFQQIESNKIRKYFVCNNSMYLSPANPVKIDNLNLKGITDGVEYIIISNKIFRDEAERFANYKSNEAPRKISARVFYVDDIFNEFAGGITDPTAIRNFVQYAYFNWQIKPKYVLLFGDGNYDILNKDGANSNFVPTFETTNSLDHILSYPKEDYFVRVDGDDDDSDLALGRFCVTNIEEAKGVVDKIISYETDNLNNTWKNEVTMVADDAYSPEYNLYENNHTYQTETLANIYVNPNFNIHKIYLAEYPTTSTGLGRRKPEVNKAIISEINNGRVLVNYTGHGSPTLWADEHVFEKQATIPALNNEHYFFLTVASCDFAEFDHTSVQSASEDLVNKEASGAIGVIAASRPVYPSYNSKLNNCFYDFLTNKKDSENNFYSVGEAFLLAKNKQDGLSKVENTNKFLLIGDPSLVLKFPKNKVLIDSLNGKSLTTTGQPVQVKALENVSVSGTILSKNNIRVNSSGEAIISVFDSQRKIYNQELHLNLLMPGGLIYKGRASLTNGRFNAEFLVPKDISYENDRGKIVVSYFNDTEDGIGFTKQITIGGTSTLANDNKGPEVQILFDNENNDYSYLVKKDFLLIVKLKDETGINTTGLGIGHRMEAVLNDDENHPIDLSGYFVGDLDAGSKSGKVTYKFTNMEPGEYKIKIKAWDVFNNPTIVEEYFTVTNSSNLLLQDVYNYPNPFAEKTTFTFQHNFSSPVDVAIYIYTVAGRMIKKIEEFSVTDKFVRIPWDGADADGDRIANGTYLYKLIVKPTNGDEGKMAIGKLAVIK